MGGLGNQMFQYAFGRRLAAAECDVRFDAVNGFAGDFYGRKFALDRFRAHPQLASPADIPAGMRLVPPWHRIAKAAWLAVPPRWRSVVYEREMYRFDAAMVATRKRGYYIGYWQAEEYVAPIREILQDEFGLRSPVRPEVQRLIQEMESHRSISIHARRNHGVGARGEVNLQARDFHGACGEDFFRQAVAEIGVGSNTTCFIFSDNPEWAKANLRLEVNCRYVSDLGPWSDAEELALMSACHHHVISNSSFSWWGAWLGRNPDKVVVAPRRWIHDLPAERNDIYPKAWRLL
jgi:hypothetical protein